MSASPAGRSILWRPREAAVAILLALAGCTATGPLEDAPELTAIDSVVRPNETWLGLGERLLQAGEQRLAQQAFERSILIDGVTADALTGAGIAASNQGLVTMARSYFEASTELAPDSVVAQNNLGVVLLRLNEYYRARRAFQAAFALSDGRNELAMRNLRLAELAIAEIESGQDYVDPAVNFTVRRLGSSEFELIDFEGPVIGLEIEGGDAVPDVYSGGQAAGVAAGAGAPPPGILPAEVPEPGSVIVVGDAPLPASGRAGGGTGATATGEEPDQTEQADGT